MGKTARMVAGKDVEKTIAALNKALADEWLAYTQYWFAEKLVDETPVRETLKEVAKDELEHAGELSERIIQLGGCPVADIKELMKSSNCGYAAPVTDAQKVLNDSVKGEGCAINVYNSILKMTKDSDPVTYAVVLHIMQEEMEHEQRFADLLEWIQ
jgi:bacterioferritin